MKLPSLFAWASVFLATAGFAADHPRIELDRNDAAGTLAIKIAGQEALVYQYGAHWDLPHYYPVRSPFGRSMTVQKIEPFPHHRSFWFADTVEYKGKKLSFYDALYSSGERKNPQPPFKSRIRHTGFESVKTDGNTATIGMQLVWETDYGQTPVLEEQRQMRVVSLGEGEYLVDLEFVLSAKHGDVKFVSDWVHYAWPFIRLNSEHSVTNGARLTNSEGGVGQAGTNGKPAHWVDYSIAFGAEIEGLAIFSHPTNGYPLGWLTRDYGTFGPRRMDAQSGKPFTLEQGSTLSQRAAVLVHRGDAKTGKVAERYAQYAAGKL